MTDIDEEYIPEEFPAFKAEVSSESEKEAEEDPKVSALVQQLN